MPNPTDITLSDALAEVRREIEKRRESVEHNQLATYCGNMPLSVIDPDADAFPNQLAGYDEASALPLERLRELFEADDFGSAWELFDSEQTEWYEQDEGAMQAYDETLRLLDEISAAE